MIPGRCNISCNSSEVLHRHACVLQRDFRKQLFRMHTEMLINLLSHLRFVPVFLLVGAHVLPPSQLSQAPYSSSYIPCSATFGHLRTLLVFCLLLNHLTPSHKTPPPTFPEELCGSFSWFLTFPASEYPRCLCPPPHPPWRAPEGQVTSSPLSGAPRRSPSLQQDPNLP